MVNNKNNTGSGIEKIIGYKLKRASSLAMSTLSESLSELNIRVTEATVLYEIANTSHITSSQICRRLGLKRSNLTPLMTRLVDLGYVKMLAKDGRSQALSLSSNGQVLFSKIQEIVNQHDNQTFAALSDTERTEFARLLDKLIT